MKTYITLAFLIILANTNYAQSIGIGTNTPSNNAILDIYSTTKGLMLPRLDTSQIVNPSAGLIIFNQNAKTVNYHDGIKWQTFANSNALSTVATFADSITYTLNGVELGIKSITQSTTSGAGTTNPIIGDLSFTKLTDINTIDFKKAAFLGTHFPLIEFKFYKFNTLTPFYSIKLLSFIVYSYNDLQLNNIDGVVETYSFRPNRIGFKDWVNNKSFMYNAQTAAIETY